MYLFSRPSDDTTGESHPVSFTSLQEHYGSISELAKEIEHMEYWTKLALNTPIDDIPLQAWMGDSYPILVWLTRKLERLNETFAPHLEQSRRQTIAICPFFSYWQLKPPPRMTPARVASNLNLVPNQETPSSFAYPLPNECFQKHQVSSDIAPAPMGGEVHLDYPRHQETESLPGVKAGWDSTHYLVGVAESGLSSNAGLLYPPEPTASGANHAAFPTIPLGPTTPDATTRRYIKSNSGDVWPDVGSPLVYSSLYTSRPPQTQSPWSTSTNVYQMPLENQICPNQYDVFATYTSPTGAIPTYPPLSEDPASFSCPCAQAGGSHGPSTWWGNQYSYDGYRVGDGLRISGNNYEFPHHLCHRSPSANDVVTPVKISSYSSLAGALGPEM